MLFKYMSIFVISALILSCSSAEAGSKRGREYSVEEGEPDLKRAKGDSSPVQRSEEEVELGRIKELVRDHSLDVLAGPDQQGETPVEKAAARGYLSVLQYVENRVKRDEWCLSELGYCIFEGKKNPPALIAARPGQVDVLEYLKQMDERYRSLFLEARDEQGRRAAFAAAENGRLNVLEYLGNSLYSLDQLFTPANQGVTPAIVAAQNGHLNVLEYLWKKANDCARFVYSTKKVLSELKNNPGQILERESEGGYTPALLATFNGHTNVLHYLVEKGRSAILEKPNQRGWTPALIAAQQGQLNTLLYIVKNAPSTEAVLEVANKGGQTPALMAAKGGHLHVLDYLVKTAKSCFDVLKVSKDEGPTPIDCILSLKSLPALEWLFQKSHVTRENGDFLRKRATYAWTDYKIKKEHKEAFQNLISENLQFPLKDEEYKSADM